MTTWAAKRFEHGDHYGAIQDRIAALQLELRGPHDLMMFAHLAADLHGTDIYISLPEGVSLDTFPGFLEISREELPEHLITLVLREDGFAERFPDIAAKAGRTG